MHIRSLETSWNIKEGQVVFKKYLLILNIDSPLGRNGDRSEGRQRMRESRDEADKVKAQRYLPAIARKEKEVGCLKTSEHIPPVRCRRLPNIQKHPYSATTSARRHSSR